MIKQMFLFPVLFAAALACAANFDAESVLKEMRADGITSSSGVADDTGFWIVAIGTSSTDGKTTKQALDVARTEVRAEMAKSISVKVATAAESFFSESDAGVKESFTKWSRTDANELLAGLRILKTYVEGDTAYAVALLAQKNIDATAKMKAAMAARPDGTVEANGTGTTKKDAIEAACRSALEQVNGVRAVASDASVDDSVARTRVYADVKGRVSSYRILSEKEEGGLWHVSIVATVVKDELQDGYGAELRSMGDPLFFVSGANMDAVKQMCDYLKGKGFKITEHKGTADYKVELLTNFEEVSDPVSGDKGTQLQITATCFDKAGVQLFTIQNDPRKAVSYSGSASRQAKICVKKAARQVGKPLHARIQKGINDIINNGRTVRVIFRNVTTKEQCAFIENLVTQINDIPGAGSATSSLKEAEKVATIRLTLKGNPQDFIDLLRARVTTLPPALSVSPNKIVFEF